MDIKLSTRVRRIQLSPIIAISAQVAALRAKGKEIIDLGIGELDFNTPEHVKKAANIAIADNFTKYTSVDGIPELKQAIIDKFHRENQLVYNKDQILVSCGGKQSFFNLAQALLDDGDEVVIPAPYWVSYPDMVTLAGGMPVIIKTSIEEKFKISPEQLQNAINTNTRLVVINSPANPTGMEYSPAELKELATVLLRYPQLLIATDDMYEHIRWSNTPFVNIVNICPALYERTIVLNGVSKAHAMTGWRIGYAAGPADLIAAMKNIQSQSTSNPASISQKAAVAALVGDQSHITVMKNTLKQRHDFVVNGLNAINGIRCLSTDGAFYIFLHVEPLIQQGMYANDIALVEKLLETAGVALVPGSVFGTLGY